MVKPQEKTPTAGQPAEQGGDHVESLGDIAKLGEQLESVPAAAPGAPGAPDPKAIKAKAAAEIATALALLKASAIPFAPPHVQEPLHLVWSDKQLTEIAEAIVDVCDAQGISVDDFFVKHGPWIRLAFALGIPAAVTIKLLKMPAPEAPQLGSTPADGQQQ